MVLRENAEVHQRSSVLATRLKQMNYLSAAFCMILRLRFRNVSVQKLIEISHLLEKIRGLD